MRGEQRFAGFGEVFFAGVKQAVNPGQQLLGAVVRVQNHRNAIFGGKGVHLFGADDGTEDVRPRAAHRFDAFAGEELGAAVGELDDDGRFDADGGFQCRVDGVAADAVYRRDGEAFFFGDGKDFLYVIPGDDAGFYEIEDF